MVPTDLLAAPASDPLTDVLRSVRLSGAVFFKVDGHAPFAAEPLPAAAIAARAMPGAEHVLEYHLVASGECWAGLVGEPPVRLTAGDVICFPRGDHHVVSSAPGLRATVPDPAPYAEVARTGLPFHLREGGDGPCQAELVCGFLACDTRPFNPCLGSLPRMLVTSDREGSDPGWFRALARLGLSEAGAGRPGAAALLSRLSELLFVELLRRHLASLPEGARGWFAGVRDAHVGRVLSALHADPARDWSLPALARVAGLSRSALVERFSALVGLAPMQYLAGWRMQRAAALLAEGGCSVAEVGAAVGYASEAAFSRAFKRCVGASPAAFRRSRTAPALAAPATAAAAP